MSEITKQEQEEWARDRVFVGCETRIDLMWNDLTDADKIAFAEMMRDAAVDVRKAQRGK